tara:strand:+ start:142 stop:321 length:180 start_codon:yes stop_codon:yes gene_type:complete
MPWNYETDCENCGIKLKIEEQPMNVPGGKDKEQAYCPECNHLVAEHMTSGFITARVLKQ